MGYLHTPRDDGKFPSRWEEYLEGYGEPPPLPSLGPLEYLGTLFAEMGRVSNNGMGIQPLAYAEIEALGRIEALERWEMKALRAMSSAYVNGYRKGADALRLPAWNGEDLWQT